MPPARRCEWARWDHGGEVTIEVIGPADIATAVAKLGTELRNKRRIT